MATHVLRAGFELTVWNRTAARCEPLVAEGARAAGTPAELARAGDVLITMLTDDEAVRAVGEELVGGAEAGTTVVDMSSVSPRTALRLHGLAAERGVGYVDAPVSGGERAAREGALAVMAGGEAAALERARPVLEAMAAKIVHVGGPGAGDLTKAVNQVIVGLNLQAVAEGLTLAIENGLDPNEVIEALAGGFADSTVLRVHGPRMAAEEFEPGARIEIQLKDLRIALGIAAEGSASMPATSSLAELLQGMVDAGEGGLDQAGIVRAYRKED
jgi:2-hydroxy-3-oxopropionate reductase